jgi:hypothetical protein
LWDGRGNENAVFWVMMHLVWQAFTGVSEDDAASIRADCPEEGEASVYTSPDDMVLHPRRE